MEFEDIDLSQVESYEVVSSERSGVHWFWWIFWTIMMVGLILVVALVHFNSGYTHKVVIKMKDNSVVVIDRMTDDELSQLIRNKLEG